MVNESDGEVRVRKKEKREGWKGSGRMGERKKKEITEVIPI
jgi:hypothetical protein